MRSLNPLRGMPGALAVVVLMTASGAATGAGERREEQAGKPAVEIVASVWDATGDSPSATFATFDRSDPLRGCLTEDTRLEGVCVHCSIQMKCRAGELGQRCATCPCGISNFVCLGGKAVGEKTWRQLLRTLPQGTRLRVQEAATGDQDAGLEQRILRLTVDMHGAILPVQGLANSTPQQLQAIGKSVGAASIERNTDGTRLQLRLKSNWTADKETRLEKALAQIGAKLASPPADAAAL